MPWPPTAGWVRPQFGWSTEFLTLGRECYLFCERCTVRGSWWEVGAGSLSRALVLTGQKRLKVISAVLGSYAFAGTVCSYTPAYNVHTRTLCPPWPLTLNVIVFLLCMPFAATLLNVSRSGESHGALVMTPKSSSTWESDLYTPPLRCEVRRGRVKKGTAPKNSCQPVGRHSAPLGATKQARGWQRGGQGCAHTRRLLRRQRRLHYWASICLPPLIRLSPFILINEYTQVTL